MRIHAIQTGTVAIKQVQRQGSVVGNPILNKDRLKQVGPCKEYSNGSL
jgi:hypothetical protein